MTGDHRTEVVGEPMGDALRGDLTRPAGCGKMRSCRGL